METITMWAEKSDKATNAQRFVAPNTHVRNAILDINAAKKRYEKMRRLQLTKTIKTPNSIFREPSAYIFRCNSLSESKLSFIDLQQTMSQSMLCFLKIQLGDMHEKTTGL